MVPWGVVTKSQDREMLGQDIDGAWEMSYVVHFVTTVLGILGYR